MVFVVGQLIKHPQCNQYRYGHAYGQSANINQRITLAFYKIPPG
jgi:hypothetical protein